MSKQYRFKIDTPWGNKGREVKVEGYRIFVQNSTNILKEVCCCDPAGYPDLFEPVPDPVEVVATWLDMNRQRYLTGKYTTKTWCHDLAERLLAAGLDPDKLDGA